MRRLHPKKKERFFSSLLTCVYVLAGGSAATIRQDVYVCFVVLRDQFKRKKRETRHKSKEGSTVKSLIYYHYRSSGMYLRIMDGMGYSAQA